MFNIVRHSIVFCVFVSFSALPIFTSAQTDPKLRVPDTIEQAKEGVLNIGDKIIAAIPGVIADIWKNEAIPLWKATWDWIKEEIWHKRVRPPLEPLVEKIKVLLGKEVEKRKPIIEQQFEQEKQELKQDIQTYTESSKKGLWERFLALFHKK